MSELTTAAGEAAPSSAAPMAEEAPGAAAVADDDDDDDDDGDGDAVCDDSDDDTAGLSIAERFARAAEHKERGNAHFKRGDPAAAAGEYRLGLALVDELAKQEGDHKASLTSDEATERDDVALSLQLNLAMVLLKVRVPSLLILLQYYRFYYCYYE